MLREPKMFQKMDSCGITNLIFTSSVAVYGLNTNFPNEKYDPKPFNHYGKSKLKAEEIIRKWYEIDKKNRSLL